MNNCLREKYQRIGSHWWSIASGVFGVGIVIWCKLPEQFTHGHEKFDWKVNQSRWHPETLGKRVGAGATKESGAVYVVAGKMVIQCRESNCFKSPEFGDGTWEFSMLLSCQLCNSGTKPGLSKWLDEKTILPSYKLRINVIYRHVPSPSNYYCIDDLEPFCICMWICDCMCPGFSCSWNYTITKGITRSCSSKRWPEYTKPPTTIWPLDKETGDATNSQ